MGLLGSGHLRDPLLLCDVTENFAGLPATMRSPEHP